MSKQIEPQMPTPLEMPANTDFNVLDDNNNVIGTVITFNASTSPEKRQTWTWDLDKGDAWPASDFTLDVVSQPANLSSNVASYTFANHSTWHKDDHTIKGPYYRIEDGSQHWRFQYDAEKQWLYWTSNTSQTVPAQTVDVKYYGPGNEHTSDYYRKDDAVT